MTTPSVDRPVSEPMTDEVPDGLYLVRVFSTSAPLLRRKVQGLWYEIDNDQPVHLWGESCRPARWVTDRNYADIWPADSAITSLLARALPLPRRYTGGPLEDGLYLWRRHRWHRPDWESVAVEDGSAHSDHETRTLPGVDGWLHDPVMICGPITIPDIPSEEASS